MKRSAVNTAYLILILLQWLGSPRDVDAQSQPDPAHPSPLVISNVFISVKGDGTNVGVLAREAVLRKGKLPDDHPLVLFNLASRQAFVAVVTNDVYALKGQYFRVSPDVLSFWITKSRPGPSVEPTDEVAANLVAQSADDFLPRESPYKRLIDLRPILKPETDLRLAQLLILRHVELSLEGGRFVVTFESYMHNRGRVVLDDGLNVLSMRLMDEGSK